MTVKMLHAENSNLVDPPRKSVHNSPRLVNEYNLLPPHIIRTCIVSESAFKVYI